MAKLHPMLEPLTAFASDSWGRVQAAHLLNRAAFGGTQDEIDRVLELGPQRAIDWLLDFPDTPADEISKTDVPDLSEIEGYPRTFAERRELFKGKTEEERQLIQQRLNQANQQALRATMTWWLRRMVDGPYPMHEKLTLFWHGHFTTSARDERSAWLMWRQNETLRRYAAGNFGNFVRAISRDPAMLDYLNNQQNRKSHPNENYARELMELFTLGIGNYTENDVKEAARAFTGWAHDGEDFIFRKYDHDDETKTFFGQRGNLDGDDIITLILRHKVCAPYIASRFWSFYVSETFDRNVCLSLGDVLRDHSYDLRPMIRTLFASRAFYAPENIGAQIKSPIQLVVGTARLLGTRLPNQGPLIGTLTQMGQVPLMPPNVKGWPGGRMWINTSTMFVRQNTAVWLAGGASIGRNQNGNNRARRRGMAVESDGAPEAIVDAWIERLIQRPVDEAKRAVLLDAVGRKPSDDSVRNMVQLILSMPEYQLC